MIYNNELASVYAKWPVIQARMIEYMDSGPDMPFENYSIIHEAITAIEPHDMNGIQDYILGFLASYPDVSTRWLFFGKGLMRYEIAELKHALQQAEDKAKALSARFAEREELLKRYVQKDPVILALIEGDEVILKEGRISDLPPVHAGLSPLDTENCYV